MKIMYKNNTTNTKMKNEWTVLKKIEMDGNRPCHGFRRHLDE